MKPFRKHARLPPSSAYRWMVCPGSVALADGVEESSSSFANEGTAAHMLAERCLEGGSNAAEWRGFTIQTNAKPGNDPWFRPGHKGGKPDGMHIFEVDAEMVEGVQQFVDVCREIAETAEEYEVEQRLDISSLVDDVFGTGDFIAYGNRRVTIVDLKYGKGVAVEVEDNKQLLTYGAGVALRYHNRGVDELELVIVQPRAPHTRGSVRRVTYDFSHLVEHVIALQDAQKRIERGDRTLVSGDHCKFCKAAAFCPQLATDVLDIVGAQIIGDELVGIDDPSTYAPDRLARALEQSPMVRAWLRSVEGFSHSEALRGRTPPGWKLVAKRANRKWVDEDKAKLFLYSSGFGLLTEDIIESKLRSPAQIEPLIPAKNKAERSKVLEPYTIKESSGTVLAPVDDPREAVDPNDSRGFEPVEIAERD